MDHFGKEPDIHGGGLTSASRTTKQKFVRASATPVILLWFITAAQRLCQHRWRKDEQIPRQFWTIRDILTKVDAMVLRLHSSTPTIAHPSI